jgi:hypothetical protein
MDAAWFAVLVLYVTQILHQRPGVYGLLLAVAALGGISVGSAGPQVARRAGPWRSSPAVFLPPLAGYAPRCSSAPCRSLRQ